MLPTSFFFKKRSAVEAPTALETPRLCRLIRLKILSTQVMSEVFWGLGGGSVAGVSFSPHANSNGLGQKHIYGCL